MFTEIVIGLTFLGGMTILGYVVGCIIGDVVSNIIYK